jgi:hypothetical protein
MSPAGTTHGRWVAIVGHQPPVVLVEIDEPDGAYTGVILVMQDRADVEDPDSLPDDDLRMAGLECVVEEWPDLQTAIALARASGVAHVGPDGTWRAGAPDEGVRRA